MKIVFIGCGNITNTRHIPAIKKLLKRKKLDIGLIGLTNEAVHESGRLFKNSKRFVGEVSSGDFPVWLKDAELILIGTPPKSHSPLLVRISEINSNAKIVIEKPLCMNSEEIDYLRDRVIKPERIYVMHNFQYTSGFLKLKRVLSRNKLGKITAVHGHQYSSRKRNLPSWYEDLPLGLFWDECSHFFYLIENLVGDFRIDKSLIAYESGFNTPFQIDVFGRSETIPITLRMNFNTSISEWGIVVHCERGVIIFDMFRDITISLKTDRDHNAIDVLRTSFDLVVKHTAGFLLSGFYYATGNKLYGVDKLISKVLAPNISYDDDQIGLENGFETINQMVQVVQLSEKV